MYLQIFFNKYCATKLDFYFKFGTLGWCDSLNTPVH
jgi:hypothetical protein